jgi:uncharacterized membrane protein YdjX (TVP38/TMEM64 family)
MSQFGTPPKNDRPAPRPTAPSTRATILIGIAVVIAIAALYWLLARTGLIALLGDKAALRAGIERLGAWGPAAIVALLAIAIVVSPLPSAPVAVVAGAAYGMVFGTALVVAGAVLGAVTAFLIARCLGFELIRRWSGAERVLAMLSRDRSQLWLMGAVFLSRLLPFISFDAVSYAAGLTPLTFWRFALATLAGVVPVSVALAYAGDSLIGAGAEILLAVLIILVAVPMVIAAVRVLWRAIAIERMKLPPRPTSSPSSSSADRPTSGSRWLGRR